MVKKCKKIIGVRVLFGGRDEVYNMDGGGQFFSTEGVLQNSQSVSSFVYTESPSHSNRDGASRGGKSISGVMVDLGSRPVNSPNSRSGGGNPDIMTVILLQMKEEREVWEHDRN